MTPTKDIYWLAGLLEGEGSFCARSTYKTKASQPVIQLGMTDRDVVDRAARVLGHTGSIGMEGLGTSARRTKPLYRVVLSGRRAIGWMMTIYPLMGERRREQIKLVIDGWRTAPRHGKWKRRKGYKYGEARAA